MREVLRGAVRLHILHHPPKSRFTARGAGVFAAFAPAAAAAGAGLLIGLGIAAYVAYCNATSCAQLAAQYPTSGGTYVHGRHHHGHRDHG